MTSTAAMTTRSAARRAMAAAARNQLLLVMLSFALVAAALAAGGTWRLGLLPPILALARLAQTAPVFSSAAWRDALGRLVLIVAAVALGGLVLGPKLGLFRPVTVLSGSMRPTFDTGDLIIVTSEPIEDLRVGQVISYQVPVDDHAVESHRVIKILRPGSNRPVVVTKGDANQAPDPWQAELHGDTLWRYRFHIPMVGYLILALRSPIAHHITVMLFPILLALVALTAIWRRPRPVDPAHADTPL
jgi:signal peptidase